MAESEELCDVVASLLADVFEPVAAEDYYARTGTVHTDHLPAPAQPAQDDEASCLQKPTHTRPSDGKPVGTAFDFEEYETRKLDRIAADPERAAKRKARVEARRARAAEPYVKAWEQRIVEAANADIASLGIQNRLLDIWHAIIQSEQATRIDNLYLDQAARIANRKNLELCERIRGEHRSVGAAARRAGFA